MKKGGDLFIKTAKEKKDFWNKVSTLRTLTLSPRQIFDLEMLAVGAFAPLKGFLSERDYKSVVSKNRLSSGQVWPMPITLDVKEDVYKKGEEVILVDDFGNPLALMNIDSVYRPNKEIEAQKVFGTKDLSHPAVNYLFNEAGDVYLGGEVRVLNLPRRYDFKDLRKTPQELRDYFKKNKIKKVIGFQTRNPIHRAHFELIRGAAEGNNGHVLIHPVVGLTKEGDIDYVTRVGAYKQIHKNYAKDFATLSLLPLAMRMAGPREALWHALIRKNYGCTHFIVGRDHAGPGKDKNGKPFYGVYDAQKLVKKFEKEIGVKLVTSQEVSYVEEINGFLPADKIKPNQTVKNISGTQFREMLRGGSDIPEWFSFPEVVSELRKGALKQNKSGAVIFFTGLSGSGKSTIAHMLSGKIKELAQREVTILDGDVVRLNLSKGLGFSKEDRNSNIKRIGFVASEIARHGGLVICSAIAPYKESRDYNRELVERFAKYIEVYVSTPLSVCEKRDVKGLYKKARKGIIKGFTGVDDPYEAPKKPEIRIDTSKISEEQAVSKLIKYLVKENII